MDVPSSTVEFSFTTREIAMFTGQDLLWFDIACGNIDVNLLECYKSWIDDFTRGSRYWHFMHTKLNVRGLITASYALAVFTGLLRSCRTSQAWWQLLDRPVSALRFVGGRFLHVDTGLPKVPLHALLRFILENDYGDYLVGMSAADMIAQAKVANASTLAAGVASAGFVAEHAVTKKINITMKANERELLAKTVGFSAIYEPKKDVSSDHAVVYMCREFVRQDYDRISNASNTKSKTLVVGSSWREVSRYSTNAAIDHYFFGGEGKDGVRITVQALEKVKKVKWQSLDKAQRETVRRAGENKVPLAQAIPNTRVRTYLTMAELLIQAREAEKIPAHFLFDIPDHRYSPDNTYSTLLFEDVGYNFSEKNWLETFRRTNAQVGYGYMMLPFELVFNKMPRTKLYRYHEQMQRYYQGVNGRHGGHHMPADYSSSTGYLDTVVASVTYSQANGYMHPKSSWDLLLRKGLLSANGYDFGLEVELVCRYGPMVCFSLTKVVTSHSVVRTIALPPELQYLQVMDLMEMANRLKKNPNRHLVDPFPYFSVKKSEFDATVNYLLALDIKSMTITNTITFVRRNVGGASLVSKELIQAWDLDHGDINRFSQAVFHYTVLLRHMAGEEVSSIISITINWREKITNWLKMATDYVVQPLNFLWSWLWTEKLSDKLVLTMTGELYQTDHVSLRGDRMSGSITGRKMFDKGFHTGPPVGSISSAHLDDSVFQVTPTEEEEFKKNDGINHFGSLLSVDGELPRGVSYCDLDFSICLKEEKNPLLEFLRAGGKLRDDTDLRRAYTEFYQWRQLANECSCDVCHSVKGKAGAQVIECFDKTGPTCHDFALSQSDVDNLRNGLITKAQESPEGLAKVMLECRDYLPQTGFSTSVEVEYIKGGPGCGKSYIIRTLGDKDMDLIVCPYLKVRTDYQNVKDADGSLYSFNFQTQHKMMGQSGKMVVFVDEFTAMDYSLLACLLFRCGTKRVYLVGDEQQTGIQEGAGEGVNIMNRINLPEMRTHVPVINFRNPHNIVSILNHLYGYRMIPKDCVDVPIKFGNTTEFNNYEDCTFMHYSWGTAEAIRDTPDHSGKTSVRCNQGSTWENIVLPISECDSRLITSDALNIVALSRHKNQLTILLEGGDLTPAPASVAIRSLVSDLPEEVLRKDYNLRLYLGLVKSRDNAPELPESEMMIEFRNMVLNFDGYVAYDESPSIPIMKVKTELEAIRDREELENFEVTTRLTPVDTPYDIQPEIVISDLNVKTTHDPEWDDLLAGASAAMDNPKCYQPRDKDSLLPAISNCFKVTYHELIVRILAKRSGRDFISGWCLKNCDGSMDDVAILAKVLGVVLSVQKIKSGKPIGRPFVFASLGGSEIFYLTQSDEKGFECDSNLPSDIKSNRGDKPISNPFWATAAKRTGLNRPNNCLLVAIAESMGVTESSLNNKLLLDDKMGFYKRWVNSTRMSDELDCLAFARILRICLVVIRVGSSQIPLGYGKRKDKRVFVYYCPDAKHYSSTLDLDRANHERRFSDMCPSPGDEGSYLCHKIRAGETIEALTEGYGTTNKEVQRANANTEFGLGYVFNFEVPDSVAFRALVGHQIGGCSELDVVYRDRDPDCQDRMMKLYDLRQGFYDYATEFIAPVITTSEEVTRCFAPGLVLPKACRPVRDAHLLTALFDLDPGPLEYDLDYLNQECDGIIGSNFVSGTVSTEMLSPVNMRGHPEKTDIQYYALTMGPANQYFKKSTMQTLKVLHARYLSSKTSSHMTVNGVNTAQYIGNLFVNECLSVKPDAVLNDEHLCSIIDRAMKAMVIKNYEKQMDENFTDGARVYRFSLKDIAKPIKETIDINKAGQGISAWSKIAQVKFMVAHRVINDMLINYVKPNVIYDNSFTEEQFLDLANNALGKTPATSINGVIDATACDSGQNKFTMAIERTIMRAMGISEMFLDWYFLHRESYILQSAYVRARVSNVKTSGEPGTLFGNSILMAAIMNALLRGEGPWAIMMKGDDGIKRQSNLEYDRNLLKEIKCHCPLDFKVDIGVPIQFCGYALEKGQLVPCVLRKLMKIAGHKFKDVDHWKDYQESLRDWVRRVPTEKYEWDIFLKVNAQIAGCSIEVVDSMVDQIKCFSHIGAEEFFRLFKRRNVTMSNGIEGLSTKNFDAKSTKFNTPFMACLTESL